MRVYLRETLISGGYDCRLFPSGGDALGWLASGKEHVDLMLSDIDMPGMNGLDLLRTVKTMAPDLPFILISGLCDLPTAHGAMRAGASDYLLKPVRPDDLLGLVGRHVDMVHLKTLEAVRGALKRSIEGGGALAASQTGWLMPIFDALGFKRFETLQHSRRVSAYTRLIARELNLTRDTLRALEIGALLHDIGKAAIPHNVVMKPGRLNGEEWKIMKLHPQLGRELLEGLPDFEWEAQIVYCHHEHFDGTGYPQQLAGESIPLSARLFSVADTLDAITSDRCYRTGQPLAAARIEIHRVGGSQFDPAILDLFDRVEDWEFEAVAKEFPD